MAKGNRNVAGGMVLWREAQEWRIPPRRGIEASRFLH